MHKKRRNALRRFRRVKEFLTTNQVEGAAAKLQVLDAVVRDMTAEGEAQDASARLTRGMTARQRALRKALRNRHMVPISRIARRVLNVPEVNEKFRLPPARADNLAILDSARGMAQHAEAHAEVFRQEGLPTGFVEQLRAAIAELAETLRVEETATNRRKTAGTTLETLVKRGIAAIDVLDAIVKPRLEDQPNLLATWLNVKRPMESGSGAGGLVTPDITPVVKVA